MKNGPTGMTGLLWHPRYLGDHRRGTTDHRGTIDLRGMIDPRGMNGPRGMTGLPGMIGLLGMTGLPEMIGLLGMTVPLGMTVMALPVMSGGTANRKAGIGTATSGPGTVTWIG
jgi:hypothetical protein